MPSRPRAPALSLPPLQRRFRSLSHFHTTPSPPSPPTSPVPLRHIPSLNVDYNQLDAEDPDFTLRWLQSFPIFGFSARSPDDPRYKAVAKFKKLVSQHDVADLTPSDFIRALYVYTAFLNRQAELPLPSSDTISSIASVSSTHSRQHSNFDDHSSPLSTSPTPNSSDSSIHLTLKSQRRRSFDDPPFNRHPVSNRRLSLPEPISHNSNFQLPDALKSFEQSSHSHPSSKPCNFKTPPTNPHIPNSQSSKPVTVSQIQLFYHMLRHAESIYGLPLNAASAPGISMTKLTDRAIICRRTGISSRDLLTSQFSAMAFLPAHYIAVDNQIKAIVICVRGTANLIDSLTDVAATHDPLEIRREHGDGEDDIVRGYGHAGVLRSARNLFEKIRTLTLNALCDHPKYQLMITGHSLGAATASVLSMIMRDDPEFPRATAVCIAPPPCVTFDLAQQMSSSTISLVNGPDIVPRLSVAVMLPYFATARYVADLSPGQKILLSFGLKGAVIDWAELSRHNVAKVEELQQHHEGRRLFIPGKVFQLVRKSEVSRRDAVKNRLFKKRDVEIVPVPRSNFLHVKGREKGMFLSHAPFNYKANLVRLLDSLGSKPLRKAGRKLRRMSPRPTRVNSVLSDEQLTGASLDSLFSIDEEDYARHRAETENCDT